MVEEASSCGRPKRSGKSLSGMSHHYNPISRGPSDKTIVRNSMAIQNLLNPVDEESHWVVVRPTPVDTDSDEISSTPASSPVSACSFKTEATAWTAASEDERLWVGDTPAIKATDMSAAAQEHLTICVTGYDTSSVSNQGSGPLRGPSIDLPLEQPNPRISPQARRSQTGGQGSHDRNSVGRSHRQRCPDGIGKDSADPQKLSDSTVDKIPSKPHGFRKAYAEEQVMWLWFFKIDLQMSWPEITKKFLARWPNDERVLGGMQCRFYRSVGEFGLPKMRDRKGSPGSWGMWPMMRRSYPWMDEHKHMLQGYLGGGPYYGSK